MAGRIAAAETVELLDGLQGAVTTVPQQLTQHYMSKSGIDCQDDTVHKLMSLAAQRFVEGLIRDAYKIHKRRTAPKHTTKGKSPSPQHTPVLLGEDLAHALEEYGINLGHQHYFADNVPSRDSVARS